MTYRRVATKILAGRGLCCWLLMFQPQHHRVPPVRVA
jgi:hypothetical protein